MLTLSNVVATDLGAFSRTSAGTHILVVGSGTAGVTTAIALARAGLSVVILEAGPFIMPSHLGSTPFRSRGDITPRIHNLVRYRTAWLARDRYHAGVVPPLQNDAWSVVGGRTLFWGGCTPRFSPWDFADWPFDYASFAPYYETAEQLMHVSGIGDCPPFFRGPAQDAVMRNLAAAGFESSHARLGVDTQEALNGYIPRGFDSAVDRLLRSGLLVEAPRRGGIVLVPEAIVERIEHDGRHVQGLTVSDPEGKRRFDFTAQHYVLAGGAVQSTRLALASGLQALSPHVGHFVADHLFVQGLFRLRKPLGGAIYLFVDPTQERPYHLQIQGPFQETWYTPYHATVWLDCDPQGQYLLVYCFGVGSSVETNEVVLTDQQSDGPRALGRYCVLNDRSDEDLQTLQAMQECLPPIAAAIGADVVRSQVNPPGSALHEIGGLVMSEKPGERVTDTYGRFWALPNLSVADAAAWPSQGSANSYLTITAWSLRHAEGVLQRLAVEPIATREARWHEAAI